MSDLVSVNSIRIKNVELINDINNEINKLCYYADESYNKIIKVLKNENN